LDLRRDLEALLLRMANEIGGSRETLVFLINNDDLVVGVLEETMGTTTNATTQTFPPFENELRHWHKQLHHATMDYVEATVPSYFGTLQTFVQSGEERLATTLQELPVIEFERISNEFGTHWRTQLSGLASDVLRAFPNFRHGAQVLQAVLGHVVVVWQRYHVLLDKRFQGTVIPFKSPPVGVQNVLVEIKKYKGSF
jgi:hypothetical protein